MDAPQLQQQIIPADALRLPDLRLQAGPREIEFEIELPKGGTWHLDGDNELEVTSSNPQVLVPGQTDFQHVSMRFMIPVSALQPGETMLTYDLKVSWQEKSGHRCHDRRELVQRVYIDNARGATVPWVHYKAQPKVGTGTATSGPFEE